MFFNTDLWAELETAEQVHERLMSVLYDMDKFARTDNGPAEFGFKREITFCDPSLIEEAEMLGAHVDTEWAEEHADLYTSFQDKLDREYDAGRLTAAQYNEIGSTAFFDFDVKEE